MEGSWLHTKWTRKWSLSVVSDSLWPMDCSLPGSSVRGIFQASILEWVTISSPRGSSWPRKWTWVSCIAGRFFTNWVTREAHTKKCLNNGHSFLCVSSTDIIITTLLKLLEVRSSESYVTSVPIHMYSFLTTHV